MPFFGWIAPGAEPPPQWDLRQHGWHLCHGNDGCRADCHHVLVCDTRGLSSNDQLALAEADRPAWRLIMIGVEKPSLRAKLLNMGCAEALPALTGGPELLARVRRVNDMFGMLPRWRHVGNLTLDLFHRDARRGAKWLGLHPREFGVLWRLTDKPGELVSRQQLLKDVWRLNHEPETNSVEVHISRLRSKLASAGASEIVETSTDGGYRLSDDAPFMFAKDPPEGDALDGYLRAIGWTCDAPDQPTSCAANLSNTVS
ncbi:winged helix-turn-helix domain-containing protein [Aurantiacibacter sp. D1-12]|uniref:winged helix-turn-helix domain-containing protein n=1 Tax=Aurantiacibacter sp. D1-12 TaxID=2993658 RepID=UPI00237CE9A4|nr:response regulator transcription factor [Aurantiacibacter sp. D1-12]MDE1467156.1 response regulator transcription factor [Aurantiacibacter sp. D1-12]